MTYGALKPPVGDRDHVQGAPNAQVTLVEYGDYECPFCGEAYPIVKALQQRLGASLCFVFRNFPLGEQHPHAELAAEAAEAAGAQGRFWEMHDTLYENQSELGRGALQRYAAELVPDPARFARDLESRAFLPRVREDFASGVHSGVNGTPTFFVNGVRHDGPYDEESLLASIQRASTRAARCIS